MFVFSVETEVRRFGLNYGLPCFMVTSGPGINYKPEDLIRRLGDMGLRRKGLVVIKKAMGEKGLGVVVDGLKYVGARVEVEASSKDMTPGWFSIIDCWIIYYEGEGAFNLMSLRPRQDLIVCKVDEIGKLRASMAEKCLVGEIPFETLLLEGARSYGD